LRLEVELIGRNRRAVTKALLDSGATRNLINMTLVKKHQITTHELVTPIPVRNVDNTENKGGEIKNNRFYVTDIGDDNIILGTDWLHKHNPEVKWQDYNLKFTHCPNTC
ncbi:hypothetical protein JAAARDRAFT_84973, partial [Jaapia argillacea MUCL 33604]